MLVNKLIKKFQDLFRQNSNEKIPKNKNNTQNTQENKMLTTFNYLCYKNKYSDEQINCIKKTLEELSGANTDLHHPGVLLGKIQSGKTRTFVGVIGLAFDNDYDYCIVLTKGTKALASQTFQRLDSEFGEMTQDHHDIVRVYDIMKMPKELTNHELKKKLIIVIKKQTKNLDRLCEFFERHPTTSEKKVLIIDDEADYASVGFKKTSNKEPDAQVVNLRTIAEKIRIVRKLAKETSFLQVTATPQALYLQPDGKYLEESQCEPTRPCFTQLVPIHDHYIGGRVYFEGCHEKTGEQLDWAKYLHVTVPQKELDVLEKRDQRYINNIFTTPNLEIFKTSIISFLVAGSIRSLEERNNHSRPYKCSFIIHIATGKSKHQWQRELTEATISTLQKKLEENDKSVMDLIKKSIDNFKQSMCSVGNCCLDDKVIIERIHHALQAGEIAIKSINSDKDVHEILDKRGQLQLCCPFNIFVGGQILDRGITIENLLGFFYGRNPKTIQEDTVLQHSRMYGARSFKDMAVTRLYTTVRLYNVMKKMHEFESALRTALEKGKYKNGVVFLEKDPTGEIKPCSPNKILISHTTTLLPHKRYLPIGFDTKCATELQKTLPKIDTLLEREAKKCKVNENAYILPLDAAITCLKLIDKTYKEDQDSYWNVGAMIGILERCCKCDENGKYIYCLISKNRNMSRFRADLIPSNAPDDGRELQIAKDLAMDKPCIIFTRQNGYQENGWRGHPFWWPVIITPLNTQIAIFANRVNE